MKIFKSLLFLYLISLNSFAGYGIVTTLEAPILDGVTFDAKVLMRVRKGDKIYIHDKYFINGPLDVVYLSSDDAEPENFDVQKENAYEKFYETVDRNGNTAYISQYYVKLITQDIREFSQNITPFDPDPNDYRPSEPLPKGYPQVKRDQNRARLTLSRGPDLKSNYQYDSVLEEEDFSNRYGFELSYGSKANHDKLNRFYFGGLLQGWTSQAKFKLFDERRTTEIKSQIAAGPYLSYDPWRYKDLNFTIQGALLIHYTRNLVSQQDFFGFQEERFFSSLGVSPKLSSFLQFKTDDENFDVVFGFDLQLYLPQKLKSSTQPVENFWNSYQSAEDSVSIPFTAHYSLFFGIQTHY